MLLPDGRRLAVRLALLYFYREGVGNVGFGLSGLLGFLEWRAQIFAIVINNTLKTLHTLVIVYLSLRRYRLNVALVIAHGTGLTAFLAAG